MTPQCVTSTWNAACWWSSDAMRVRECARIGYLSSEPQWTECATVMVEPPWLDQPHTARLTALAVESKETLP